MLLVLPISGAIAQSSQVFISELWTGAGGQTAVFYHNVSKTDDLGNVYVAGSTINTSGNHDIIVQKFDKDGDLLWQQTYNGAADMDDMAADLFIDNQYNVYVTGAITVNSQNSFDLGVLKFNSSGVSQWQYVYNGGGYPVPYDAGTAITGDNNGSVYVTGGSFGATTMSDYVTARIDASNGNEIWLSSYDHDELNDLSAKIAVKLGQVIVSGASQISTSPEAYELATITYAASNGNFVSERRTSGSATDGVDEVYDLIVDDDGFIYIAGAVKNTGSNFDIKLYKLDDDLNIVWEVDFDGYGAEDKAHGVAVNDEGEIYLTGFVTHPIQGRNIVTLKYDTAGTVLWNREYHGEIYGDDEGIQLVIDDEGRVFVAGEIRNGEYSDYVTIGYDSDGSPFGQAVFDGPPGLDDRPSGMAIDLDGNIIVTGLSEEPGGELRNRTVKYSVYDKPIDPVIIDSVPSHNADEILVWFNSSVINKSAIDKRAMTAGQLTDFIKPAAISSLNSKVDFDFSKLKTFKVIPTMSTSDSVSISRLGDTTRIDDFWATLSIIIPSGENEQAVVDSLQSLHNTIRIVQVNYFNQLHSEPNDPLYDLYQDGLFDINIESAWGLSAGQQHTRIGVFDSGITYWHEDLSDDGTWNNSVISGGYDFVNHQFPQNSFTNVWNSHGTSVASIMAATKNNEKGIAGICGRDDVIGSDGCRFYDMRIVNAPFGVNFDAIDGLIDDATAYWAMTEGAADAPSGWGYALTHQNHSWGGPDSGLKRAAVNLCYRQSCTLICSAGNTGGQDLLYPASYSDRKVLKIGGSFGTGNLWSGSTFGNNLDVIAPATTDLYEVLHNQDAEGYTDPSSAHGTSFAASHVTGIAGLMYSQHHVNNGYPNNLAPEDMEEIIQKTAFDLNVPGPDIQTGHGRLNGGESVRQVTTTGSTSPLSSDYFVLHLGGSPVDGNPYQIITENQVMQLTVYFNDMYPGTHYADLHTVYQTFNFNLNENEEIIDHWKRYSSSSGVSANSSVTLNDYFDYEVEIVDEQVTVTTQTNCWYVPSHDEWIPTTPSFLMSAVSIHIKNQTPIPTGLDDNNEDFKISLYPNPSDGRNINIEIYSSTAQSVDIQICNYNGQIVQKKFEALTSGVNYFEFDCNNLAAGIYLIRFLGDSNTFIEKFVLK